MRDLESESSVKAIAALDNIKNLEKISNSKWLKLFQNFCLVL
jgi:hypothetical protein